MFLIIYVIAVIPLGYFIGKQFDYRNPSPEVQRLKQLDEEEEIMSQEPIIVDLSEFIEEICPKCGYDRKDLEYCENCNYRF